jgi:hypothetical protein
MVYKSKILSNLLELLFLTKKFSKGPRWYNPKRKNQKIKTGISKPKANR